MGKDNIAKSCKRLHGIVEEHLGAANRAYDTGNKKLFERRLQEAEKIAEKIRKIGAGQKYFH